MVPSRPEDLRNIRGSTAKLFTNFLVRHPLDVVTPREASLHVLERFEGGFQGITLAMTPEQVAQDARLWLERSGH